MKTNSLLRSRSLATAAAICVALAAPTLHADTVAFTTTGGKTIQFGGNSFGYTFTLSSPIQITKLGFFDSGADGLQSAVPVTLWDKYANPLATVTVPAGTKTGEISQYLYVTLATPVTLPAGSYLLAGYVSNSSDLVQYQMSSISSPAGISYNTAREGSGSGIPTSDAIGEEESYFGPNFQFNTIAAPAPEPSTWALLGVGTAGLGLVLRRLRARLL